MNLGLQKITGIGQDSDEKVNINFDQTLFMYMHHEKVEPIGSSSIIPGGLSRTTNSEMPINMDFRVQVLEINDYQWYNFLMDMGTML